MDAKAIAEAIKEIKEAVETRDITEPETTITAKEKIITEEEKDIAEKEKEKKLITKAEKDIAEAEKDIAEAEKDIAEANKKGNTAQSNKELVNVIVEFANLAEKKARAKLGKLSSIYRKIQILSWLAIKEEEKGKKVTASDKEIVEIQALKNQIGNEKDKLIKLFIAVRFRANIGRIKEIIEKIAEAAKASEDAKNNNPAKAIKASEQAICYLKELEGYMDIPQQERNVKSAEAIAKEIAKKAKAIEEKAKK